VKKVFHFDSPTEKYHADACVVSCYDARFELATRKFLKKHGIWMTDPLSARSFALGQVRTSMQLHGTNRLLLMIHSDCGAYGGLQAFGRDEEREALNQEAELRNAAEFLNGNLPSVVVECYFLRFNGIWAVEAA